MFIACERGQKSIVLLLLEMNANVNEKDSKGNTALTFGIDNIKNEFFSYISDFYRVKMSNRKKLTMLFISDIWFIYLFS